MTETASPAPSFEQNPVHFTLMRTESWVAEGEELRAFMLPGTTATPGAWFEALVACRAKLDRLETLLRNAADLHARLQILARQSIAQAKHSWDELSVAEQQRGARSGNDYETGREREARVNLRNLKAERVSRQHQAAQDIARDAELQLRTMYRGLDGVRMDIHRALGYFPLEHQLERT